jgi:hypothetical protein
MTSGTVPSAGRQVTTDLGTEHGILKPQRKARHDVAAFEISNRRRQRPAAEPSLQKVVLGYFTSRRR